MQNPLISTDSAVLTALLGSDVYHISEATSQLEQASLIAKEPNIEKQVIAAEPANASAQGTGVMSALSNLARTAFNAYTAISPTAIAMNAIATAIGNAQRGVTGPTDHSQATTSVQTSAPTQSPSGGGSYLPINANTGIPSLSISSDLVDDFYNRYKTNLNRFK
jgi:hypothetical protein